MSITDMAGRERFDLLVVTVMVACMITIILGSTFIAAFIRYQMNQAHPLPPVIPASELPGEEMSPTQVGSLIFCIDCRIITSHTHSGIKGVDFYLEGNVTNIGTDTIDDLCFQRMTVYWADGGANFTSGILPSTNHTIGAGFTIELDLDNAYDWPEIPVDLCGGGGTAYGRLLITYDTNDTFIITTPLTWIIHAVE